jgi:hypothetical protein
MAGFTAEQSPRFYKVRLVYPFSMSFISVKVLD